MFRTVCAPVRRLIPVLVATVALTVSCSSASTEDGRDAAQAPTGGVHPATVDTAFGAVDLESAPTRVVALGWGDAETALALGVQPVGASDWLDFGGEGVGPWAEGLYDAPPEIIGTLEPSYEAVAALEPDLILDTKSSGDVGRHDRLAAIAPTVGIPEGAENYTTSYEDQVTMVAAALGVPEKGAELISGLDDGFRTAAANHPEFADKTVTVGALSGTGYGAYIEDSERVQFLTRLGFRQNPTIASMTPVRFSVPIADEQLGLLDADLVVMFPIGKTAQDIEQNPLFRRIPAVAQGHAIVFDDPAVAKSYSTNSALSLQYALDTVVPMLAAAVRS
ncbi:MULTISPECIES: iron-siderophore ABC transporter substrate-binding protein [Nocardiaceae]|uniref:Iron complex transport system substrate-binding protein n=1 Tax=Rhodococcoides corynebacterioides TaxID=53972 RepID=A0ABS2KND1_9NOCA|nr:MULTISPECIES: iron-siderophore ABC transporter substrate-binding protein [Rhodococcus]MBM7413469.1 iron complex transport system substrate-binding protein [Rhodococcus corynebacterioides]